MVLNIFPRRRELATVPAPQPEPALPEPSAEAMAEIEPSSPTDTLEAGDARRRTRRGTRGGRSRRRDGQPETGDVVATEAAPGIEPEAAIEVAPLAEPEAKPRTRRPRTKPTAEPATPVEDTQPVLEVLAPEAAPEAPKRPSRRRGTKAPAAETPPVVAPEPATPSSNGKAATHEPAPAGPNAVLRAVEQQQKQIDQLVRLHEDLAKRIGAGPVTSAPPARVGVFVDAANIELACDRMRARFDWRKILDMVTKDRVLVRAIAYSPVHDDPGVSIETQRFVEPFLDKGFKVVTKALKRFADGTIKANVDIELALDVIEMLDRLDVVVLASGDGDFQRLVEVLQSKGIRVEVAAVGTSTASNLRHAADKFIDLQSKLRDIRAS